MKTKEEILKHYIAEYWQQQIKVDSYAKLLLYKVSGSLPLCKHEFEVRDQYWSSCKHCGMIIPNGNGR